MSTSSPLLLFWRGWGGGGETVKRGEGGRKEGGRVTSRKERKLYGKVRKVGFQGREKGYQGRKEEMLSRKEGTKDINDGRREGR